MLMLMLIIFTFLIQQTLECKDTDWDFECIKYEEYEEKLKKSEYLGFMSAMTIDYDRI